MKKKLSIAFEGQSIMSVQKTGVGRVADTLLKGISRYEDIECHIQFFGKKNSDVSKIKQELEEYNIIQDENRKISWRWYKIAWSLLHIPHSLFFKACDITIFPNFIVPIGVKGKKIAIVHDMAYLAYQETVKKDIRIWLKMMMKKSCKRADMIITVSEFSKQELIKYLNIPSNKIEVIYNGVDERKYIKCIENCNQEEIIEKYKLNNEFFLYLGTLEPRKNIVNIIKAYKKFSDQNGDTLDFILAGKKGWMYDEIFELIDKLHLRSKVKHIGYVEDKDIPVLLSRAKAFVFPSLYEGFGLPVLEAMACGTPVITSNNSSLKEIAKDAAILVDPLDIDDLVMAFEKICNNKRIADELRGKGYARIKDFSWEKSVEKLVGIIRTLQ